MINYKYRSIVGKVSHDVKKRLERIERIAGGNGWIGNQLERFA